ncbi:unnamed protein product [Linum trigynum]|uniref:Uncharacterized protein n=1 Tax=Linum trigynum TaxID=586398 RepID=A0AAV2DC13_9ROSI
MNRKNPENHSSSDAMRTRGLQSKYVKASYHSLFKDRTVFSISMLRSRDDCEEIQVRSFFRGDVVNEF